MSDAADQTFRDIANAAYAAFIASPPEIVYRVDVMDDRSQNPKTYAYIEGYETRTYTAVRRDLTTGIRIEERSFFVAPNLDAIATFGFGIDMTKTSTATAYSFTPLTFRPAPPNPAVDAVATFNRAYTVTMDRKDRALLHFTPTKNTVALERPWLLTALRFDTKTLLPKQVALKLTSGGAMTIDFVTIEGHLVVRHVQFSERVPLYFNGTIAGSWTAVLDATYSAYAFPEPAVAGPSPEPSLQRYF